MWMRRSSLGVGKLTRTHRLEVTLAMSGDPNQTSFELVPNTNVELLVVSGQPRVRFAEA